MSERVQKLTAEVTNAQIALSKAGTSLFTWILVVLLIAGALGGGFFIGKGD